MPAAKTETDRNAVSSHMASGGAMVVPAQARLRLNSTASARNSIPAIRPSLMISLRGSAADQGMVAAGRDDGCDPSHRTRSSVELAGQFLILKKSWAGRCLLGACSMLAGTDTAHSLHSVVLSNPLKMLPQTGSYRTSPRTKNRRCRTEGC